MSELTLADVAHVVMGQSPDGATYNKQGIGTPLLNGPAEFGAQHPIVVQWTTEPAKLAIQGDVLFCVRGNTLGRQNIADRTYAIGRGLAAIRARDGLSDTSFISLWLRFRAARLLAAGNGSTFPSVSGDYLESLTFPNINPRVQGRIAVRLKGQLDEVDAARQAVKTQADDIALLRRRVLTEVFAAVNGAPRKRVGDHAATMSGSTPPRGVKAYWTPAEVPWVKTGEVAFAPITRTEEAISRQALAECSLALLPPGTVLVAMIGQGKTRGQSAILEIAATTNQNCFAILPNDTWEPQFLFHWMKAHYQHLRELSGGRGGSQSALNGALLNALEIPAPSPAQQAAIAHRAQAALRDIDALAAANRAQRAELDRLPQHLLARAFEPSGAAPDQIGISIDAKLHPI